MGGGMRMDGGNCESQAVDRPGSNRQGLPRSCPSCLIDCSMMTSSPQQDTMDVLPIVDLDIFLSDPGSSEAKQEAQNVCTLTLSPLKCLHTDVKAYASSA